MVPRIAGAIALVCWLGGPTAAAAQTQLSLTAGPSAYDLDGTGTAFAANLGLGWRPFGRGLVIEPSVGFLRYDGQLGRHYTWLFPEIGIQGEAAVGRARPYLGIGGGAGRESTLGRSRWEPTLHGAAGLRLPFAGAWGARGEVRVRLVDPSHGNSVDFGIGLIRSL